MTPISITATLPLSAIKQAFRMAFPQLKLEFFGCFTAIDCLLPIRNNPSVGDVRQSGADGYLRFRPGMTVKQLERLLQSDFGLRARVFRRAGSGWLRTTLTTHWTLEEQNQAAFDMNGSNGQFTSPAAS